MSGTNTQTPDILSQTPKRRIEKSPTEEPNTPEQEIVIKAQRMSVFADKNDIQELKDLIHANTLTLQQDFLQINNTLRLLREDMSATKKEIANIKSRVEVLETAGAQESTKTDEFTAELNAMKQIQMETQLSIHNIPQNIDTKHALECLSSWTKINLNDDNVKHSSIVNLKNKDASIMFLDFYDLATKHKVMKHVRFLQKDKDKKYIPILTEHIFKLETSDAARGIELHFRDAMTDQIRDIFNTARKEKKIFTNVWKSRGYVMVRINEGKPTKIISKNQLNSLSAQHQNFR
ncbi:hypothetical protein ACKWTF_001528 [Chironomus riparius]